MKSKESLRNCYRPEYAKEVSVAFRYISSCNWYPIWEYDTGKEHLWKNW